MVVFNLIIFGLGSEERDTVLMEIRIACQQQVPDLKRAAIHQVRTKISQINIFNSVYLQVKLR